jgi:hypothetical protein
LGLKGCYSERDKFDLEGMPQTLTMIGTLEGALPAVAERIKNLIFYFAN